MSKAALLSAAAQTPPSTRTRDFAQAAASSDLFEIREGQVATAQSQDPQVRAFAQEMIEAHTHTSQALMAAVAASGLTPPSMALSADQAAMLGALQSQKGPDFDRTYIRQQALAHQQALVVTQAYANGGPDANVRQVAQSKVPVIQRHLQMALQMKAASGGS